MVEAHWLNGAEQAASRVREVAGAEERVWKNDVESWRRREMAWQFVMVVLERKEVKKLGQESVVKLLERLVSKGRGMLKDDLGARSVGTSMSSPSVDRDSGDLSRLAIP